MAYAADEGAPISLGESLGNALGPSTPSRNQGARKDETTGDALRPDVVPDQESQRPEPGRQSSSPPPEQQPPLAPIIEAFESLPDADQQQLSQSLAPPACAAQGIGPAGKQVLWPLPQVAEARQDHVLPTAFSRVAPVYRQPVHVEGPAGARADWRSKLEGKAAPPSWQMVPGGLEALGGGAAQDQEGACNDLFCVLYVCVVVIGVAVVLVYFFRSFSALPSDLPGEGATTSTTESSVLSKASEQDFTAFRIPALQGKNNRRPRERAAVTVREMGDGEGYVEEARSTGLEATNGPSSKFLHVTTSAGSASLSNYSAHSTDTP